MKAALKLTVLAAALAVGAIATMPVSVAQPQDAGTTVATEQRQVAPFSAIELAGPYHVVIDAQAKPSLALSGERRQLADVETIVRGDTLVVRPVQRDGFFFSFGKRRETVTIRIGADTLKRLTVAGSGDVDLAHVKGERFTLAGNGPGDVHASGAVRQLSVTGSGSGDLDLHELKAADVDVALNGPGDIRLGDVGGTLAVRQGGAGDLDADGVRAARVTARMHGPGGLRLSGSARELDLEMTGAGDFEGCDLRTESVRSVQRGPGNACIAGTIRAFDGEVDGSGDLTIRGLQAGSGRLRMNGPGNVALAGTVGDLGVDIGGSGDLTASLSGKRLRLRMSGPGDARIDGTVAQVDAQITGSGSLEGRGLVAAHADIAVHGPGTAAVNVTGNGRAGAQAALLVDRDGSHPAR